MPSFRLNSQYLLAALFSIAISGCSSSGSGNSSEAPADDNTNPAPISTPGETETETGTESEPETETETETESKTPADPQAPEVEQPAPSPGAGEPVIPTTEASFTEVDQPDWSILMSEGTWRIRRRLNLFGTPDRLYPDHPEYLGTRYDFEQLFLFTVETVSDGQLRTFHCGDFHRDTYSVPEFGARLAELVDADESTEEGVAGVALCATPLNNRYFVAPDALRVERYCQGENVATFEFVRISNNTQFEVAKVSLNSATTGSIQETTGVCGDRLTNHSKIDPDYLDVVEEKYRDFGGYTRMWSVMIPYGDIFLEVLVHASGHLTAQHLAVGQTWPLFSRDAGDPMVDMYISKVWPDDSVDDERDYLHLGVSKGTLEVIALEEFLTTLKFDYVTSDGEQVSGSFTIDFGQQ